ncbi:hypothetical protein NUU61_006268 [Penicillium alfredii]|uniref:GAT domain-containing protein n=1 Tax=Penicillium alfredii TaxID=1506179 RepID=A0A9W9F0L5_9EURO|nr:uncharacterized protein NUU61_006268 [Penicillium alfredii]KAJ5091398.1 hypothetical protein NUU61_006268 [Penicillium alfredii]
MKRFLGNLSRRSSTSDDSGTDYPDDSPEGILLKEINTFCDSSESPDNTNFLRNPQGNEYVRLPRIVELAESSPNAAKAAALRIRRYLADPAGTPPHVQFNAIMVMRILGDNPGHSFTCNFDAKFVATIKNQLRNGRDPLVQRTLRQYLMTAEVVRAGDQDLALLMQMWGKERQKAHRTPNDYWPMGGSQPQQSNPMYRSLYNNYHPPVNSIPQADELAARIAESRNSAKLLTQFVQSTPPAEIEENELIKEFADRCRTASRIIQSFIHATNPPPDENTLLTLIETNDELSVALSQQQRAMLKARKLRGSSTPSSSNVNSPSPPNEPVTSGAARPVPPVPSRDSTQSPVQRVPVPERPSTTMSGGRSNAPKNTPATTARYEYNSADFQVQNPFADDYAAPESEANGNRQPQNSHESSNDRARP